MPRRIVRAGQVLLLTTLLVPATAPVLAASPSPAASVPPAAVASPLVSASPAPTSPAVPVIAGPPHDAPRLEALLPIQVDGAPLFRTSYGPATWATMGADGLGTLGTLTDEFGVELDALTMAFANDPSADPIYNLFAVAVTGVPGETVNEVYSRLAQSVEADSTLESVNLGGIDVTHLSAPNNQIPHVWTWAVDDVMLGIQAADEETATRLIALLPTTVPAPEPAASGSVAPVPSASVSSAPEPAASASTAP